MKMHNFIYGSKHKGGKKETIATYISKMPQWYVVSKNTER